MANINTVETKSKFGVPINGTGSGILMPKLKYRFRVTMLNFGGEPNPIIITQNVQTITRPQIEYASIPVDSYNSKIYITGKHEWQGIELSVRDDITNATTRSVGAQVQRQVNHFQQTAPAAGSDYKFDMQIETLDGTNAGSTEVFFLEGCFLTNVNYGDHDYSSGQDMMTITMSVRYDNCTQYQGDNDVNGRVVGGNPFPDPAILNTFGSEG